MLVVFIEGITVDVNGIVSDRIPKLYIGVGYNPDLKTLGERLDMLDFFYWMSKLPVPNREWVIWDASSYYIVNRIPNKRFTSLGNTPKAQQVLEMIVEETDKPKRAEVRKNCMLRLVYLTLLSRFYRNSMAFDIMPSDTAIRQSQEFESAFDISVDYVRKLERDRPELVSSINPKNDNPASKLYLPLEIAEAIYLKKNENVGGKFGPASEEFFDECILGAMKTFGMPYATFRCPNGPRRTPYLTDRRVIRTFTSDLDVAELLKEDRTYRQYVEKYLSPFNFGREELLQRTIIARDILRSDFQPR